MRIGNVIFLTAIAAVMSIASVQPAAAALECHDFLGIPGWCGPQHDYYNGEGSKVRAVTPETKFSKPTKPPHDCHPPGDGGGDPPGDGGGDEGGGDEGGGDQGGDGRGPGQADKH